MIRLGSSRAFTYDEVFSEIDPSLSISRNELSRRLGFDVEGPDSPFHPMFGLQNRRGDAISVVLHGSPCKVVQCYGM
ncbi:hypothetical protein OESDEN_03014 [Oesophagostomum dentatum]|uniref:Uncharacterized protein n=1 Tax=Oesophagostomum dentatum TaxID=61180 RepID=A0A0B1TIC8_OESDE|nr:hypothetical protein OESDEN_03014 [Oesophagostomum dentatum]